MVQGIVGGYLTNYKTGDKVYYEGKPARFLRAHLNGKTCAIEKGKPTPLDNGVICVNLSDLTFVSPAEAKVAYLRTSDGSKFVDLLRKYENTLYAKVRYPEKFFTRYKKATGIELNENSPGILISKQVSKYGDELSIRFKVEGDDPVFPKNATPRVFNTKQGILNDNDYIWSLIEDHGFRFQRES